MKTVHLALAVCVSLPAYANTTMADTFGSGDNTFDIEFVTIGDPGNPADTTGDPSPAGAVDYVYRIGKYEISREMVEKANAEGGLGITLDAPDDVFESGFRPAMPATSVSWNEAARFVNWLNTSQGFPAAYRFSTQPGDPGYVANRSIELWQPGDAGYDANNLFRNRLAHYFLPSVHEWYKAAFYDPNANGGEGGYWNYATGRDAAPTPVASGTDANTAVYDQATSRGPADITQSGGLSPYGTMAQSGNVNEWEETEFDLVNDNVGSNRAFRGGDWINEISTYLGSWDREGLRSGPAGVNLTIGFRVASIPEPSSQLLGLLGMLGVLLRRRR